MSNESRVEGNGTKIMNNVVLYVKIALIFNFYKGVHPNKNKINSYIYNCRVVHMKRQVDPLLRKYETAEITVLFVSLYPYCQVNYENTENMSYLQLKTFT